MKNSLYFGDNLEILKDLYKKHPEGFIDLIYIDPPFNSKRNYNILFEDIDLKDVKAQKEAFKDTWSNITYIDTLNEIKALDLNLHSFIQNLDQIGVHHGAVSYLTMMAIRIWYMHKLLKDTGSFYLHCDSTMSHYLKILCDLIFGENNFRGEIIWRRASGFKRSTAKKFPQKNDNILHFSKGNNITWNPQYLPHKDEYIKRFKKDKDGRLYRDDVNPTKGGTRIIYLDEVKGDLIDSVWIDIHPVNPMANERLGYPTQKPISLMERIVEASTNEGDLVADFFCGCGTTIAAAQNLNRKWLGADISHLAVKLISKRLIDTHEQKIRNTFEIFGFPQDLASAKMLATETKSGRFKFEEWIIEVLLGGVLNQNKNQTGFDGYITFDVNNDKDVCFIEVKSGNATLPQLNHFIQIVEERKADMGVFVCFKEQITSGMEKTAKTQGYYKEELFSNSYNKIQLLTVEELLEYKGINMPISTVGTFKSAKKAEEKSKQEGIF